MRQLAAFPSMTDILLPATRKADTDTARFILEKF